MSILVPIVRPHDSPGLNSWTWIGWIRYKCRNPRALAWDWQTVLQNHLIPTPLFNWRNLWYFTYPCEPLESSLEQGRVQMHV